MAYNVLVVEDDDQLRDLLAGLLTEAGYDVQTAADGLAGLRCVLDRPPELIVSDVLLPCMTGLELCALLKDSPHARHIPLIFLTCVDDPVKGFDVGADDYLVKPFRPRELLARVRALFRRTYALTSASAEGLRGTLAELCLLDVLQALHIANACGCLTAVLPEALTRAKLWMEQGELVAARLEGEQTAEGEEALFVAAAWEQGLFAFDSGQRAEAWTLQRDLQSLLLEAARRLDEGAAAGGSPAAVGANPRAGAATPNRAELESRVDEIRNRLKLKAFTALMQGHPITFSETPLPKEPHPEVALPAELDQLIERMLRPEEA